MCSIIHFLDENTVETVPSKWFLKNKCAWPNNKSKRHIADKSYPIPQCFKWYKARALLTDLEPFSEANRKCKKSLYTTNLSSTETENEVMNKNQKKPKEMLQYNLTKRKKIKLTGYNDNDKFSDNDTADDDDNTVLKVPSYESGKISNFYFIIPLKWPPYQHLFSYA
ncbi:uncharacterized protein LOC132939798 [Metopolophium dirhodum]|uniref:uncharacterized protein LOC132939798 n=1 Tax=Metopolophium dirhodum TaxID=44670 RepID=UPI00298F456C|nr:uncharacterized protein LOC132939798 [Metopolophium dirhodum]